jgi:hypothetical protein
MQLSTLESQLRTELKSPKNWYQQMLKLKSLPKCSIATMVERLTKALMPKSLRKPRDVTMIMTGKNYMD